MTRDEILNMPAGEMMDKLICVNLFPHKNPEYWDLLKYSTDIAAAWEVVEKMSYSFHVEIMSDINGMAWGCDFKDDPLHTTLCVAETAPLAICRAALLTVMK